MRLFVSYARSDRPKVDPLAQRLRQAGNDVWVDTDLAGGQVWWDKILDQLRQCDAVLAVVSRSSLKSQACMVERRYATGLGKAVLPLTIEHLDSGALPYDIARLQVTDYSQPDEAAAFQLVGAIMRLPPPTPLPHPLPAPPEAPSSYWDTIADQLSAAVLSLDQQLAIVGRLEGAFAPSADPNEIPTALELLRQMEARTDLYAAVDRRIASLRTSMKNTTPPGPPPVSDPPPRQSGPTNNRGGTRPGAMPPPQPVGGQYQMPTPVAVSAHWVMAIVALICFWPTGIPAIVYASRVKPSLSTGNVASARASSSRVKVFFWISIALLVLVIIVASASSNSNSQTAAAFINPVLP